jgi:hypothetical protein
MGERDWEKGRDVERRARSEGGLGNGGSGTRRRCDRERRQCNGKREKRVLSTLMNCHSGLIAGDMLTTCRTHSATDGTHHCQLQSDLLMACPIYAYDDICWPRKIEHIDLQRYLYIETVQQLQIASA